MKTNEKGNAIIFVLLAVFLFAALSYVFINSAKTGQGNLTKQQTSIAAQELVNFGNVVERAVNKLLQRGCSEQDISFVGSTLRPPSYANYLNGNSPPDNSCHVFQANGGGLADVDFTGMMVPLSSRVLGQNMYLGTNAVYNVGTIKPDLIMMIPDLTLDSCNALNSLVGITGPMATDTTNSPTFVGSYPTAAADTIGDNGTNPTTIAGKTHFCMQHAYPFYQYIQVLIAR